MGEHVIRQGTLAVRMTDGNYLAAVGLLERIADLANAVDEIGNLDGNVTNGIGRTLWEARQVVAEARFLGVIERRTP